MSRFRSIPIFRLVSHAHMSVVALLLVAMCLPHAYARGLLVSSRNTNSIKRFDAETGAFLGDFVTPSSGGLTAPQEVLFKDDGHLLVAGPRG